MAIDAGGLGNLWAGLSYFIAKNCNFGICLLTLAINPFVKDKTFPQHTILQEAIFCPSIT